MEHEKPFYWLEKSGIDKKGIEEAKIAGKALKKLNIKPDLCFTSALIRAQKTLDLMLDEMDIQNMTIIRNQALNERDYGDLAGLNKDDARKKWGDEQVHIWRRSFDVPPPGGESLKDTANRVLPYFETEILPKVLLGETILVVAHGNSLRALVMQLEGLSPKEIVKKEIATGDPIIYQLNEDGSVKSVTNI